MIYALVNIFSILVIGTSSGYLCQKIGDRYSWFDLNRKKKISVFFQKLAMIWFLSITYVGSLWILDIENMTRIVSLPFVGAVTTITGGYLAIRLAKHLKYTRLDTGSLFTCGYFSNNVTLGGMICFYYLGETAYALVPIITLLMRFLYFGFGYPLAHMYGDHDFQQKSWPEKLMGVIRDPFFNIGLGAIIIGFLFNLSPLERPEIYTTVNQILVPLTNFILFFSVGFNFKLSKVSQFTRECFYISFIKFIAVPLVTLVVVLLLGYQSIYHGLPLKVSLIIASMPVAFNSVIASNVYNLNIDMVNSCWIFTTFGALITIPILLNILNLF